MSDAVEAAGHALCWWEDAWWSRGLPPLRAPALFHGSLGNAARLARERPDLAPGALCDAAAFACSAWYPRAAPWRLQRRYEVLTASALAADPVAVARRLGADRLFVRPDSPLKPFSGRTLEAGQITLAALDHGFYYDDAELPVIAAPAQPVGQEWRFVVLDRAIIAGSAYVAQGRAADAAAVPAAVQRFAEEVAAALAPPERAYVLDLCEASDGLRLMELNPFSGADFYGCDLGAVVAALGAALTGQGRGA